MKRAMSSMDIRQITPCLQDYCGEYTQITQGACPYSDDELTHLIGVPVEHLAVVPSVCAVRSASPYSREFFMALDTLERLIEESKPISELGWWDTSVARQLAAREITRRTFDLTSGNFNTCLLAAGLCLDGNFPLDWLTVASDEEFRCWRESSVDSEIVLISISSWLSDSRGLLLEILCQAVKQEKWADAWLDTLEERERDILRYRFGLEENTPRTLEEIGTLIGLTRERVRQIEGKTLLKLKRATQASAIPVRLSMMQDDIWALLAGSKLVIHSSHMSKIRKSDLPGMARLMIQVYYGNLRGWLDATYVRRDQCWFNTYCDADEVAQASSRLTLLCSGDGARKFPMRVSHLAETLNVSQESARAAIHQQLDIHEYKDYAVLGHLGPRARRAVRLHRILSEVGVPQLEAELLQLHNEKSRDEKCSLRDLLISLSGAPHLFVSLGGMGWATLEIGESKGQSEMHRTSEEHWQEIISAQLSECEIEPVEERNTGIGILAAILDRKGGVCHLSEIRDEIKNLPGMPLALGSVGLLYGSCEFFKLAPGVWALTKRVACLREYIRHATDLLTEEDCRLYVMSRFAGENYGMYPTWQPGMEMRWCQWARDSSRLEIYQSLLVAAKPNSWPAKHDTREKWCDIVHNEMRYHLEQDRRHSLTHELPTPRELYAAMRWLREARCINWMRLNLLLGNRVDSHGVSSILALLLLIDSAESSGTWQQVHLTGGTLEKNLVLFGQVLGANHAADWTQVDQYLHLSRLVRTVPLDRLGWVQTQELTQLVDALLDSHGTSPRNGQRVTNTDREEDSLESLLETMRLNRRKKQRQETFTWLEQTFES